MAVSRSRAFDLRGRDRHAIAVGQDLIGRHRLPIDSDQVVVFFAAADALVEQVSHGRAVFDVDVVCEAAAVVVDVQDFHGLVVRLGRGLQNRGDRRAPRVQRPPRR